MTGTVHLDVVDGLATVVFDNLDRRNAMSTSMWEQIPQLCVAIAADSDVRVVVLTGAGDQAFVAGADITEFNTHRTPDRAPLYDELTANAHNSLRALPVPVAAKIKGVCIGGGLALALSADVRFCDISATFGLPPARLGIGYSVDGVGALVDVVGPGPAAELLFSADWIDAARALRWGLVNEAIEDGQLDPFVDTWVNTVKSRAPLSQRAAKRAIQAHLASDDRRRKLGEEAQRLVEQCYSSEDYREGINAFNEKRRPRFVGR